MTADTLAALLTPVKKYARIDYTDDDDLAQTMVEATVESMAEVIPGFDPEGMTGRQKIILYATVKDLYDNREKYGTKQQMQAAAASLMLSEIYEPKAVQDDG